MRLTRASPLDGPWRVFRAAMRIARDVPTCRSGTRCWIHAMNRFWAECSAN